MITFVSPIPALPPVINESCSPPSASLQQPATYLAKAPIQYDILQSTAQAPSFALSALRTAAMRIGASHLPVQPRDYPVVRLQPVIAAAVRVWTTTGELLGSLRDAATIGWSAVLHASPQPPPVDVPLGSLPVGKTVRVVFDVTVNTVPVALYSNQGTVSGTNFAPVLTNTATTTGDRFDTGTALVSSLNPSSQGDSITFTATVTPAEGAVTPDGTVQFKDGGGNLGSAVTCAAAPANTCTAQFTTTTLATGTRSITAQYGGGTNHDASTSNTVSQVNNACTATPITVTTNADGGAGSLRQAIIDACAGNTIGFGAVVGSIDLTSGELTIDKHLTITGPGANLLTVQRTSGTSRIFSVGAGRTVSISGLTIAGGNASPGAGILNDHGTLTIANSTISGNGDAGTLGGAIFNDGSATGASLTIVNSTLTGNASLNGGALYNQGIAGGTATVTIANSTISGNTAIDSGGGIYNVGATTTSAPLTVTNGTITNNRADNDSSSTGSGGGLTTVTAVVTLRNTLAARNFVGVSPGTIADDIVGALDTASSLNNLIGVDTGMTGVSHGVNGNQVGTSGSPIDPRLGPLANNGGPTFTHALLAGSLALEAGDDSLAIGTTDQRGAGFARIRDAADANTTQTVDIGALEADPSVEDIADKSTNEDTPLAFTFSVGDSASAFDSISATSSNATLLPNANAVVTPATPSTRTLTLTPATDQAGTTTVTVTATKTVAGTPLSMSDTFVLTVTAVNDPPTIDAIANPAAIPQNAGTQTVGLTGISAGEGETGQTLTVTATSNNTAVIPHPTVTYTSPNSTGSVSYAPVPGANGSAIVTVTVTDNGGGLNTISTTFSVTVTAPPTISNIADQTVPASTSAVIPFTVADTETAATSLTVTAVSSNQAVVTNSGLVVSSGGASRTLTLTPVPNTTGTATITVTVTDGDGLTASDTFVATIVPSLTINDASVAEGDSGSVNLTFTVTLAGPSASPVSVFYATRQRTAIQGIDYAGAVDTVSFNPGVTGPSTFTVTVNGDTAAEINETLLVNLSGATGGAVITRAQGVGTITDNDATPDRTAELASWARRVGVTASGGSLTKTALIGWNAGASSTQSLLTGDGSVEFSATSTDQIGVVGLSRGDTNTDFSDVDFGIQLYSGARFYIVEAGVYAGIGPFGAYDLGDRFAVTVTGGIVSYQKNGVTIHTTAIVPASPLLVDTALFTPGMTIADVVIAGTPGAFCDLDEPGGRVGLGQRADEVGRGGLECGRCFDAGARERGWRCGVHDARDDDAARRWVSAATTRRRTSRISTSGSWRPPTARSTCSRAASRAACSGRMPPTIGSRSRSRPAWSSTGGTAPTFTPAR